MGVCVSAKNITHEMVKIDHPRKLNSTKIIRYTVIVTGSEKTVKTMHVFSTSGKKMLSPAFVIFMSKNFLVTFLPPMEGKRKLPR